MPPSEASAFPPHDASPDRTLYGDPAVVRDYAKRHQVLRLVDTLVNELLVRKPEDPLVHLARFATFLHLQRDGDAIPDDLVGVFSPAAPSSTGMSTAQSMSPLSSAGMLHVPGAKAKTVSFNNPELRKELQHLWETSGRSIPDFNDKVKQAIPPQLKIFWRGFATEAPVAHTAARPRASPSPSTPATPANTAIVSTEQISKFDSSEDVKTKKSEAVENVTFYAEGFKPQQSVFEVVAELKAWHAAGRKMWPGKAIARVEKNCRLMERRHNYGEPAEVVIPLFIYSLSVFREVAWAFWVDTGAYIGRWCQISFDVWQHLEAEYRVAAANPGVITFDAKHVDHLSKLVESDISEQVRLSEEKDTNAVQKHDSQRIDKTEWLPGVMTARLHGGKVYDDSRGRFATNVPQGWEGLTVFAEDTTDSVPGVASVYFARYELTDSTIAREPHLNPLHDSIAWIPIPSCIFPSLAQAAADKPAPADGPKSPSHQSTQPFISTPLSTLSFASIPPPGVLEYLCCRRTVEHLRLVKDANTHDEHHRSSLTTLDTLSPSVLNLSSQWVLKSKCAFEVTDENKTYAEVRNLVVRCINMINQNVYDQSLHDTLRDLLTPRGNTPSVLARFEEMIVERLGPGGMEGEPTPLNITHSLDIQEIVWSPQQADGDVRTLYTSLSGGRYLISDLRDKPCPLFRVCSEYSDQPYWHLNATMRSLQNKTLETSLIVPPSAHPKGGRVDPQATRHYTKSDAETFVARDPALVGKGLGCLSLVASADTQGLREKLTQLKSLSWLTALHSTQTKASVMYTAGNIDTASYTDDYLDPVSLSKVGWWQLSGNGERHYLKQSSVQFNMGGWMVSQVKPLLYYVDDAMRKMCKVVKSTQWVCAPQHTQWKCYRGLRNAKLSSDAYARGNVVLWAAFSSTSMDQGISAAYANGLNASVFIIKGKSCRLIAPWSRFGREEEWLYPLNSMFQVHSTLTEDQRNILGKTDFQLYEIAEVDHTDMERLQIRRSLAHAQSKETAAIIFGACNAVVSGNGFLDMSLASETVGHVDPKWLHSVSVSFDANGQCPVVSSNVTKEFKKSLAEVIVRAWQENQSNLDGHPCAYFDASTEAKQPVLQTIATLLGVNSARGPSFVELYAVGSHSNRFTLSGKNPTEKWELTIELRKEDGHEGFAIKNEGAALLADILKRKVCVSRIDLRNNGINHVGAEKLLKGLRENENVTQLTVVDTLPTAPHRIDTYEHSLSLMTKKLLNTGSCCVVTVAAAILAKRTAQHIDTLCTPNQSAVSLNASAVTTPTSRGCYLPPQFPAPPLAGLITPAMSPVQRETDLLQRTQRTINIRCSHHRGSITSETVEDFGETWPYYAALGMWDLKELNLDFSQLFDTQPDKTTEFVQSLAERCLEHNAPFPKMPGALVAAARCGDLQLVELLLDMGCRKDESDEYGETPYLKLARRQQYERFYDDTLKQKMLQQLHLCVKWLRPLRCQYDQAAWKIKNFALEMLRLAEAKDMTLMEEIVENLAQRGEADLEGRVRCRVATLQTEAQECIYLSKLKTPVGRMNTTLLCFKLFCSEATELDELTGLSEQSTLQSTGRRRNPNPDAADWEQWVPCSIFSQKIVEHADWLSSEEEGLSDRRCTRTGIVLFYYQFEKYLMKMWPAEDHTSTAWQNTVQAEWDKCDVFDKERSKRRKVRGEFMTAKDYTKRRWKNAEHEPPQEKKENKSGYYVFRYDWIEAADGSWSDKPAEPAKPLNERLEDRLGHPSHNMYDPTVFGGRHSLQESRRTMWKWGKLWACVNSVLAASGEEKDRLVFRAVNNVPGPVMFHHLKLRKGQLYCIPAVSLWKTERRVPNTACLSASQIDQLQQTGCPLTINDPMTREEFASYLSDNGCAWRGSLRKWTQRGYQGELLYHDKFTRMRSLLQDPDAPQHNCPTWAQADREDPHSTDGRGLRPSSRRAKRPTHRTSASVEHGGVYINKIIFTARGRMLGESVGILCSQHDVLLPALETFVVEDVQIRGSALAIDLISRGSLFKTDNEMRTWCVRLQSTMIKHTESIITGQKDLRPSTRSKSMAFLPNMQSSFRLMGSHPSFALADRPTPPRRDVFKSRTGGYHIFFSKATQMMPPRERSSVEKTIQNIIRTVNKFDDHRNRQAGSDKSHAHAGHSRVDGAMPYTYRPTYAFLSQLRRLSGRQEVLSHIPYVELQPGLMEADPNTTVEISAKTIKAIHDESGEKDTLFENLGIEMPNVEDVHGDKTFKITYGEIQQLIKSTTVVTSPSLPRKFFLELVGKFTAKKEFLLFFNVFRATPLIDVANNWNDCCARQLKVVGIELEGAEGRRDDAKTAIAALEKKDSLSAEEENTLQGQLGKKYRNDVLVGINQQKLDLLQKKTYMEQHFQHRFARWVHLVLEKPDTYGFISERHAQLNLDKSLIELSTEVCVSQRGFFFTSGVDDDFNTICERPRRNIAFLSAPGIDFCYPDSTLREAPKYFERIPRSSHPHEGWKYFKEGKREEFHHRVKMLYSCIFEAAQQQGVRNMSMLPMGLGQFLHYIDKSLHDDIVAIYFRAQYELLSEKDWGFDNVCRMPTPHATPTIVHNTHPQYWISANRFEMRAIQVLEEGLDEGGDYNTERDDLSFRCNLIFHNKDAKFLATKLASLDMAPSFLNPSDSQALLQGNFGMYWELGRSWNFVGEEDWGATSTGVLSWYSICGEHLGMGDSGESDREREDAASEQLSGSHLEM